MEALSKFGSDAWDRVVCVMTTGQAWQFKVYKWNEPKALFHHGAFIPVFIALVFGADVMRYSERSVRVLVERSGEPEDQGLERHTFEGVSISTYAYLVLGS